MHDSVVQLKRNVLAIYEGETVNVAFLGEPKQHQTCFVGGINVLADDGLIRDGYKVFTRAAQAVWVLESGRVSILDMTTNLHRAILKAKAKYNLATGLFAVSRENTDDGYTRYKVVKVRDLTPAEIDQAAHIQRPSLDIFRGIDNLDLD
jgi:hypothetical protein